ncbi:hypothetical protein [Slackia heliotrinireducens]|uniref:hypothetical protein n=1 Tax=Slackia heliotrinireducens TaxID=84110 RepID=UPI003314FF3E
MIEETMFGIQVPDDFSSTPVEIIRKDSAVGRPVSTSYRSRARKLLDSVTEELCISKTFECGGWETVVKAHRKNLPAILSFISEREYDGKYDARGNDDDVIEIIGYWD